GTEKIDLQIHKDPHPDTKDIYPIIEVKGFSTRPIFCKSSAGKLQEGALYLRSPSARTIAIATPDDWDNLIDICVEKRQNDLLQRFTGLMTEMGLGTQKIT